MVSATAIRSAEASAPGAQHLGHRVEVVDAERDVVDPPLGAVEPRVEQFAVGDREDLQRAAALAEERGRDPELRQLRRAGDGEGEQDLRLLERGVEVADEIADVVEGSEHGRDPNAFDT